jgi:predicted ATPase/serine/threonine protein kinase
MPVSPDRLKQVRDIFLDAVARPADERRALLDAACGGDASLLAEVQSLLLAYGQEEAVPTPEPAPPHPKAPDPDDDSLLGTVVDGKYRVEAFLGRGGMGTVYRAYHLKLERPVALKFIRGDVVAGEARIRRFEREAQTAARLRHPHIVTVHDFGVAAEAGAYLVMELIEGRSLRQEIKRTGRFPLPRAVALVRQACSAVHAAHAAGVVHRDLKPDNIVLEAGPDGEDWVKVLDFGLAKLLTAAPSGDSITVEGAIIGTPAYMSPEQCTADVIDSRSDVYALGCVLYELVAGRTPFVDAAPMKLLFKHASEAPPPPSAFARDLPPALDRVILKALEKRPEDRYQTVLELGAEAAAAVAQAERDLHPPSMHWGPPAGDDDASRTTYFVDEIPGRRAPATEPDVPPATPPTNLPPSSPQLIGRERALRKVLETMRDDAVRLLTLTGIGGTGKTCLARHVARELLPEYSDGVFLVDLATLTDPELVGYTIAQTLGVKEAGGGTIGNALKDFLREKRMLLVFDNFEQVVAAANLVADLLASAPQVKALVTSRAVLHLSAEREYGVPPLELPPRAALTRRTAPEELMQCAAVALFVDRAAAVKPGFALTRENATAVAEICTRLDGLPLALELAAARVKVLQPNAILARLENRLKLLTGGARDLPSRQQTMRGAIAWSYDLLDEAEKTLLRRLSVFAGGCTIEAAEAICDADDDLGIDVLDGLTSLADKSLVTQSEQNDEAWFRMLELVREFARESLEQSGEVDLMATRHEAYFLAMTEEADEGFGASYSAGWTARLEREHDNLRAALARALETDSERALRLTGALSRFWRTRGYLLEGRRWYDRALSASGAAAPTAARAKALFGAGDLIWRLGELETAIAFYEESLGIGREVGDARLVADTMSGLGIVKMLTGRPEESRAHLEESIVLARQIGNMPLVAKALNNLGEHARSVGEFEAARRFYEESLAANASDPDGPLTSIVSYNLGAMAIIAGDYATARGCFRTSLAAARELGFTIGIQAALEGFSMVAAADGDMRQAARLFGATEALGEELGINAEPNDLKIQEPFRAAARAGLGDEAFDAAIREGRALRLEEAIALAEDDSAAIGSQ